MGHIDFSQSFLSLLSSQFFLLVLHEGVTSTNIKALLWGLKSRNLSWSPYEDRMSNYSSIPVHYLYPKICYYISIFLRVDFDSYFRRNEFRVCMKREYFLLINTTQAYMFTLNLFPVLYICLILIQPNWWFLSDSNTSVDKDEEKEFIKDFHVRCKGSFAVGSGWKGKIPSGIQQL